MRRGARGSRQFCRLPEETPRPRFQRRRLRLRRLPPRRGPCFFQTRKCPSRRRALRVVRRKRKRLWLATTARSCRRRRRHRSRQVQKKKLGMLCLFGVGEVGEGRQAFAGFTIFTASFGCQVAPRKLERKGARQQLAFRLV